MNLRRYSKYTFWEINNRIGSIWVGHNDPIIGHNEPIIGWKKKTMIVEISIDIKNYELDYKFG